MDQMQLRMQPSGAQLGHVPSAPVTEVQRIAKHGSQQQQSTPSEIVHAAHSHGNGAHGSPQAVFGGVESASENASASDDMPAAKPGRPASSDLPHPLDRIPDDPSLKPDETEFIKAQLQYDWQGHVVDCEAAYHSSTPKRVIDAIGDRLSCNLQFNCSRRLALSNLHVLSRGRPPFLRLRAARTPSAMATFREVVDAILVHERDPPLPVTTVSDGSEVYEIMFVPVFDLSATQAPGGGWNYSRQPCFWCYRVVPGSVAAGIKWLTMYRMPVVLDLDDTLVVANGETALRDKRDKVKSVLEDGVEAEDAKAVARTRVSCLEEEIKLLETDLRMLREYIESNHCIDENGKEHNAVHETAFTDLNCQVLIKRPVIRMMRGEEFVTVFTRIDPNNAATSMIIRVRAGWEKLKEELMAPVDASVGVRKWDTYICTAAEQPYALEVYRLLDPEGEVISKAHLKHHLVCVSRDNKKSLRAALHHPLDVNRYQHAVNSLVDPDDVDRDEGVDEDDMGASGVPTMSIAIIVDDRMDVWEAAVRDQLVMAAPFNHYPTCAAAAAGDGLGPSRRGHDEMARILNYLRGLRRDLFHFWDNCVGPAVRAVLERGVPHAFYAMDMHAIMAASPYVNVNSMRPSAALPMPADAAGNIANQDNTALAPVDPRKRREQSQQKMQQQGIPAPLSGLSPGSIPRPDAGALMMMLPGPPGGIRGHNSQPQPFAVPPQPTLPGPPPGNSVPFVSPGALAATATNQGYPKLPPPPVVSLPGPPPGGGNAALPQDPRRSRTTSLLPPPPFSSAKTAQLPPGMSDVPPAPSRTAVPPTSTSSLGASLGPAGAAAPVPAASGVPGIQVAATTAQPSSLPSTWAQQSEHDERVAKIYDAPIPSGPGASLDRDPIEDDFTKTGSYEMLYGVPKEVKVDMQHAQDVDVKTEQGSDDGEITDEEHSAPQLSTEARSHAARNAAKGQPQQVPVEATGWGTGLYDEDQEWEDEEQWDVPAEEPKLSEAEVQEKLWTLGQGGLPFVVVAAEEQPDGSVRHRPLRVQQNPVINSWAQFMQPGDVVPAIAVDPDPAKRPECIVIRMDQAMVDQTCALNQNYHEMLSQKMQQNYQFNTPTGVSYTLPPWVLLDLDSQRHSVTDLFYSFSTKHAPMPPLPQDLIMSAMEQWTSFHLRRNVPDYPANTPFSANGEAPPRRGQQNVHEAAAALQNLMKAKLAPDETIAPVTLPQPQMTELCQNEASAPSGWLKCVHGHPGPQEVALLHVPVGFKSEMQVHYAMRAVPGAKQASKLPRMPVREGGMAHGPPTASDARVHNGSPAPRGSPGLPRASSSSGRKHGTEHVKREESVDERPSRRSRTAAATPAQEGGHGQVIGLGYVQAAAPTGLGPGMAAKDQPINGPGFFSGQASSKGQASRLSLSSMLWREQGLSTNPTQFLYQRAQSLSRKVYFVDRTIDVGSEKLNEMKVYIGSEQEPMGQGRARTKKEAKRLAAIAAHEVLDAEAAAGEKASGEATGRGSSSQGGAGKGSKRGRGADTEEAAPSSGNKRKRSAAASAATTAAVPWNANASSTGGYGAALVNMATSYAGLRVLSGGKDATAGASTKGYGGASGGVSKMAKVASPEPRTATSAAKPATGGYGGAAVISSHQSPGVSSAVADRLRSSATPPAGAQAPPTTSQSTDVAASQEELNMDVNAVGASEASGVGQDSDEEEGEIR